MRRIDIPYFRLCIRFIWMLLLAGCLSPIDFPAENIGGQLVISGQISPLKEQNIIQLGTTADSKRLPFPVSGALITLFDDAGGSYIYVENSSKPGFYILPDVEGVPGRTYHIVVTTQEGNVYQSVDEKMPDQAGQVATTYEILFEDFTDGEGTVSNEPFIKVYANAIVPASEGPSYLKWSVDEVFKLTPTDFPDPFGAIPPSCYIDQNADPQRIVLFDGSEVKATSIDNLLVASRIINWTFLERHYFTTTQSSLTPEAYDYWRKVNILANQVGSIFDSPPAEISGNMYNVNNPSEKVLGYFQAANQTYDRFFILPFNLPFFLKSECLYDPNVFQYPKRCLECWTVPNSSFIYPEWF
jgi:hypothetical protein